MSCNTASFIIPYRFPVYTLTIKRYGIMKGAVHNMLAYIIRGITFVFSIIYVFPIKIILYYKEWPPD